jgi:5,10-methenyltetrahydrofolate synthetase
MNDLAALRRKLIAAREALPDRLERAVQLQSVLRVWLVGRREQTIGGYWPIKGEFDPLPALYRWAEADDRRRIGLPVLDRENGSLHFRVWYPGCPMELDAHDIPKPKGTEPFQPQLLLLPCVGYGPEGVRLGYGGGFYDRTIAKLRSTGEALSVGVTFAALEVPAVPRDDTDQPLDWIVTEREAIRIG